MCGIGNQKEQWLLRLSCNVSACEWCLLFIGGQGSPRRKDNRYQRDLSTMRPKGNAMVFGDHCESPCAELRV